jgi:hypothetical protein
MRHPEQVKSTRVDFGSWASLVLVLCAVLLGSQATPVFASQTRLFAGSFGAASSTPTNPYPLSSSFAPNGVAVNDATHDVYVTDSGNHRVEEFGPTGEFVLMFGKEVNLTKVLSAAPEAEQNVCTASSFDICQSGASTTAPGGFKSPTYIAVDNTSGESKGDVYVADNEGEYVSKFGSSGALISGWADKGQLDGSTATGAAKGPFGAIGGIAVDVTGNLWVAGSNASQMFEYRQDAGFVTGWIGEEVRASDSLALDSQGNLYFGRQIEKYEKTGHEIGRVLAPIVNNSGTSSKGLAVDPTHDELYADIEWFPDGRNEVSVIQRYDSSCKPVGDNTRCTPVESFGSSHLHRSSGIAIDSGTSADVLYVADEGSAGGGEVAVFSVETVPDVSTLKATSVASTSATLNGSVNPSGVELKAGLEGCRFEWGETEAYGHIAPCDQSTAQIGSGSSPVEVSAAITGLQQGKTYHFRLVASNANDVNSLIDEPTEGSDLAFGPPVVESASAIAVAANGASVQAQVNPNNVDTRVRVEYGTEAGVYGHSTPETGLGADGVGELVPFQLSGLIPRTVYHYRVVAENALGEGVNAVLSADGVFTTQAVTAGFSLPDERGWELVSPPDKHGTELKPISSTVVQASVAGDAISYVSNIPTEDEPGGHSNKIQVLSRRTVDGWKSQDLALPHEAATGVSVGQGQEYRLFSSDLSLAVAQPFGHFDPQVSAEASEQTAFLRTDYPGGNVESPCLTSCYRPLVTGAPGYENVPAGSVIGPECSGTGLTGYTQCGPQFVGASPDLGHIVLRSREALTEGAPKGSTGENEESLYEWSDGTLVLVSVLPDGQPASVVGSGPVLGETRNARNAVSSDGSRVVWSDAQDHLYVRDTVREVTVRVGAGAVQFQAASSDGAKIFFTEGERTSEGEGLDLRECTIVESEGGLHCEITDLTPVGAGENPGVLGLIPGISNDGSYVYFVSNTVLENSGVAVPGAQPGKCSLSFKTGAVCDLYVWHDGTIKMVAVLSDSDGPDYSMNLVGLFSRVSPDGRWLEFMSDRSLTGYDNRDSVTGESDEEVYLYDASANSGEGKVVCASCNPTGVRPHGNTYSRLQVADGGLAIENAGFAADQGIAANVPSWVAYRLGEALYQPRYLSDSGHLFFDSSDALVPQDSNGTGDVYEYEPTGVGDCTSASATFAAASNGCVSLISSGTSKEESAFLDASENGDDVFFLSFAQLSHMDTDSVADVYDARVGGGFPEVPSPPVCEGDACQSPVSAPEDPTPGSLTYSGPGNPSTATSVTVAVKSKVLTRKQKLARALGVCMRVKSRRARRECVVRAHKKYGGAGVARTIAKRRGR